MNYEIPQYYIRPLWPCFIIPRESGTTGGLECKNNECRQPAPTCAENSQSASLGTADGQVMTCAFYAGGKFPTLCDGCVWP
jgi:hypothetical protein